MKRAAQRGESHVDRVSSPGPATASLAQPTHELLRTRKAKANAGEDTRATSQRAMAIPAILGHGQDSDESGQVARGTKVRNQGQERQS